MQRHLKYLPAIALLPVAAVVAGCGGSGNNDASAASSGPPKTASATAATVGVDSAGSLGKILVDSKGDTLYLFAKDNGTTSACTGACATSWPPLRVSGKPTAGSGVTASKLGTTKRSDGQPQVTYNGHPLYTFAADASPGDTSGQGVNAFGAPWYVLSPTGSQVTSGGTSGSSNGY